MNVTSLPKVRDLTGEGVRLPIETDGSAVCDLILTLWSAFDPTEDFSAFELGADWFTEVADSTPPELRAEIEFLGGVGCHMWLGLMGLIVSAPYPHDIESVLEWLEDVDPVEMRRGLLSYKCGLQGGQDVIDRAATGDEDALEELLADKEAEAASHYRTVFGMEMGELRDRVVEALRRFHDEVYHRYAGEFGEASSRAAAARRALVRGADPEQVIEEVTNGLDYRIPPGVTRLVLLPSVVLRPWALIDRHRSALLVAYPVADEFLDADPDAPPSWVVKLHKALGDERRLRILRRLSDGGAGLEDLAEMLGLTKSTVHHHVGLLRAAGLVRVHVDPEAKTKSYYTLRPTVLPDAQRTLDAYLRTPDGLPQARSEG